MNVMILDTSLSSYFVIHLRAEHNCGNHVSLRVVVTLCKCKAKVFVIDEKLVIDMEATAHATRV
jgi:hypothetical protein